MVLCIFIFCGNAAFEGTSCVKVHFLKVSSDSSNTLRSECCDLLLFHLLLVDDFSSIAAAPASDIVCALLLYAHLIFLIVL